MTGKDHAEKMIGFSPVQQDVFLLQLVCRTVFEKTDNRFVFNTLK